MTRELMRRTGLGFVAVLGAAAISLGLLGRRWWCECGTLSPWSWLVYSSHNSQHLIDPYTGSHVLHGFIFFWLGWLLLPRWSLAARFLGASVLEAGWEILENTEMTIARYRAATVSLNYFGDSIFNSLADIIACAAGFLIAARLPARQTVLILLLVELVMLATIRDNLALNIIMLLYPLDAIRGWQAGG